MKTSLKYLPVFIALFFTSANAQESKKIKSLSDVFRFVTAESGRIKLTCRESGPRYLFSVDGSKPRVLEYNETLILPAKFDMATLNTKGHSVTLNKVKGKEEVYEVVESFDKRSLGLKLEKNISHLQVTETALKNFSNDNGGGADTMKRG